MSEWSFAVASSSPRNQLSSHPKSLPLNLTTTASGVQYYDLTGVNVPEEVVLGPVKDDAGIHSNISVRGSKPCNVHSLVIMANVTLDESIVKNCHLSKITFNGYLKCQQVMTWKRENENIEMDYQTVICKDIVNLLDGVLTYPKFTKLLDHPRYNDILCPKMCECFWNLNEHDITWVTIDCDNSGLNDWNLPTLPNFRSSLTLNNNKITSMKKVIDQLEDHNNLLSVQLNHNLITSISAIPPGSLKMLSSIGLQNNRLTQLDPMVIESLFRRKGLELDLDGNSLSCGCHLYHVNRLYLTYCSDIGENPCISKYMHSRCISESDNIPIYEMNNLEGCKQEQIGIVINYWILVAVILGFLNIIAVGLIIDIILILSDYKGTKNTRRPMLDYIVGWISPSFKSLSGKEKNENEKGKLENVMSYLRDTSAMRPTRQRGSTKRLSTYPGFYD
ncbi:hypothetical protein Pmani_006117 [Petrolisthes manimaculis]|uniref:Uncharacterized protein n=1 Tax=Petrolisthes manimaculis TaxID=1843537 RepID=A0AAE1QB15_9EUCA|nr:hypothetical protein Pmani_006117 [Petrolisthes manimaculis]